MLLLGNGEYGKLDPGGVAQTVRLPPPVISVVMPLFNGGRFLASAMESVLTQSQGPLELLVLDDGSTDDSAGIARSFGDPRIRLLRNATNQGVVRTRNRGIREARGEFIAFLDCDDIALPDRLETQLSFLRDNPGLILVGSWIALMDEQGELTGEFSRYATGPQALASAMLFDNCFAQSAVMVRREALLKEGYREEYPCAEDYDLFARLTLAGKGANIPRVLTLYREHGGGLSKTRREQIVRCTHAVHAWQLERLGIAASRDELQLHGSLGCLTRELPTCEPPRAATWLARLYHANRQRGTYPEQHFLPLLLEKLALSCLRAPARPSALARHYLSFPAGGAWTKGGVLLRIVRRNLAKKLFAISLARRKGEYRG